MAVQPLPIKAAPIMEVHGNATPFVHCKLSLFSNVGHFRAKQWALVNAAFCRA
jgi:hypothetical protein